jgi:hypothetical protein
VKRSRAWVGRQSKPPKTKKLIRRVSLGADMVVALQAHRRRQLEERMIAGPDWIDSARVFTRPSGSALIPEYVSRTFRNLAAAAGLPVIRLHELRHTSASLALAAGVAMRVVSEPGTARSASRRTSTRTSSMSCRETRQRRSPTSFLESDVEPRRDLGYLCALDNDVGGERRQRREVARVGCEHGSARVCSSDNERVDS